MDQHIPAAADLPGLRCRFLIRKAFSSPVLHPFPEPGDHVEWDVIDLALGCKGKDDKSHSPLLFKFPHESDLVGVDVLQRKGTDRTFLCIEAHRDPLDSANVIHGALHIEISQCDMAAGLIDLDGRDGRGDLLDQRQSLFPVALVGTVDELLQGGSP